MALEGFRRLVIFDCFKSLYLKVCFTHRIVKDMGQEPTLKKSKDYSHLLSVVLFQNSRGALLVFDGQMPKKMSQD